MMQGLHHQQQQLAALLTVALPKDTTATATATSSSSSSFTPSTSTPTTTTTPAVSTNSDESDSARLAAINSLHRAIRYPPNSILVAHSASFLAQGFSQLLSDKYNSLSLFLSLTFYFQYY